MKIEDVPWRFTGQVKYSKQFGGGSSCWKTGSVVLVQREHNSRLEVYLDVHSENPVLTLQLQPSAIQNYSCKENAFFIKVHHPPSSADIATVNYRPDVRHRGMMRKLKAALDEIKGQPLDDVAMRSEVARSNTNIIKTPSRKGLFTNVGNTGEHQQTEAKTEYKSYTESPKRFTSVKENVQHNFEDDYDLTDGDFKENSTPHRPVGEKFFNRGVEKSKQSLEALGPKLFYSSTPKQNNFTSSTPWLSSTKRPGLMPSPTPAKKQRLSNSIPYSMKARTTAEEQKQQHTLQGFSNLGNTCYMNAILQSLFGLDTLAADLLMTNRKLLKSVSPQSLYYALAKLLNSRKQNVSEDYRRELLRKVKGAISASAKRFSGYGQHDAHEFLGQVLDQLKEEVVKISKSTPSPVQEPAEENTMETDYINPTTVNFEFEVMHTITCQQCREDISKVEQFHDVSVDLPKRKSMSTPRSLQDSLSIFFKTEEIEYTCEKCGNNKSEVTHKFTRLPREYTCEKCGNYKSEVTHKFTRLPRVFIIHLKRYSYDQTYLRNTKMAQSVRIPSYITLESHCEETTQPAFPVQQQHITQSKEEALPVIEDKRDETPKRKLDFPPYKFNKQGLTPSTTTNGNTGPETGNQEKEKEEEANLLKPLDDDLEKAIQMSLKDEQEREQLNRDYGEDNESNFQKALEMSRHEEQSEIKTKRQRVEDMTEDEQFQLAIQQSLMYSEPYHQDNSAYCDDIIQSVGEHAYAESYDIGPDENSSVIMHRNSDVFGKTSQMNLSSNVSGNNSLTAETDDIIKTSLTAKTDDIIKTCSEAVLSSAENKPVSPEVFSVSDSGSDVLEFYESDGSQKLTKIEDRKKLENKNKNRNFTSGEPVTSVYFSDKKDDFVFKNSNKNYIELPGGGKTDTKTVWSSGENETGSSDTDDFELTIETESEYKRSTCNPQKSFPKSENKKSKMESNKDSSRYPVMSDNDRNRETENFQQNTKTCLGGQQIENVDVKYGTNFKDSVNDCVSKVHSNGQYIRKCQIEASMKKDFTKERIKHEMKDDTENMLKPEIDLWNGDMLDNDDKISNKSEHSTDTDLKTPIRSRLGQKLEDIEKKSDKKSAVKDEYRDKCLEELHEKLDNSTGKGSQKLQKANQKRLFEDKDIHNFQCNEDDSWISLLDNKENQYPSQQRPMLSDPSDMFDNSKTTNDEVDGYIEENMDIPEINNEKGDLPYSYKLVSVVSHMGISSSTGHYISDVYDIKKRCWFSFDDSHVSKITESDVKSRREGSGYIFFYMNKDIYDDLCLHQAVITSDRKKNS